MSFSWLTWSRGIKAFHLFRNGNQTIPQPRENEENLVIARSQKPSLRFEERRRTRKSVLSGTRSKENIISCSSILPFLSKTQKQKGILV